MNNRLWEDIQIILEETSSYKSIKSTIDGIYNNFSEITKISAEMSKPEPGTSFPYGIVQSVRTSAGIIKDYVKTTKYLRGIKNEIDQQLKILKKENLYIAYLNTGPFAHLIIPLLQIYDPSQLKVTIIDFHKESTDSVKKLADHYKLRKYFSEIIEDDPLNFTQDNRLFDIVIIDSMQKALSVEPQVAFTHYFLKYLSQDGSLVPNEIKVYAQLADLRSELSFSKNKWTDYWLNIKRKYAKEKRIKLSELFILNKQITSKYDRLNLFDDNIDLSFVEVPPKIGKMKNIILSTEITVSKDIILCEEDGTGNTGLYFDMNLLPAKPGMKIDFSYNLGAQPGFTIGQHI